MENTQITTISKITYVIELNHSLDLISPYIFAQRLKELIEIKIADSKVLINCSEEKGVILIECNLSPNFPIDDNCNVRKKINSLAEDLAQNLTKQNNFIKTCYQKSYGCFNSHEISANC